MNNPIQDAPELCKLGATQLYTAYSSGALSPVEVVDATLDRAEQINPRFNAFTFVDKEGARKAARLSEKRWQAGKPLSSIDGVPTTLKEIVWANGWSVRYGSTTTPATPFDSDAPSVARLRAAGAVFIGQTTSPELGWKAVTDSRLNGITRNPWNAQKTPGGSSGGAAVAAAIGAGVLHLGTDGGGSIRIPSAFTGIAGIKPTFGRVPAYPASPFGTVAHIGPMARSAADLLIMLDCISGRDLRDWSQPAVELPALGAVENTLKGARVGYWSVPPFGATEADVKEVVEKALRHIEAKGASIEPIELPGENLLSLFHSHWFTGAATRLSMIPEAQWCNVDPGFLEIAKVGQSYSAVQLQTAHSQRAAYGAQMDALLDQFDFIVSPGAAITAFDAGLEVPAGSGLERWTQWAGFSYPINLSQHPACVIPCGLSPDSLPVGLQIVAARGHDARVLSAAIDLQATSFE